MAECSEGVVMTLEETLNTLKSSNVRKASFDSAGNLLQVEFETAVPTFPTAEPNDNDLPDDPWTSAAKTLAKIKPAADNNEIEQ